MSLRTGKIKNHQLKYDMPLIVKHELILKMLQWRGGICASWNQGSVVANQEKKEKPWQKNVIYSPPTGI